VVILGVRLCYWHGRAATVTLLLGFYVESGAPLELCVEVLLP
jgi:hypothetical protein